MRHYQLSRFADDFRLLQDGACPGEPQLAVDLLMLLSGQMQP